MGKVIDNKKIILGNFRYLKGKAAFYQPRKRKKKKRPRNGIEA